MIEQKCCCLVLLSTNGRCVNYIKEHCGIDTEQIYPYEAKNDSCRYKAKNTGTTYKVFVDNLQGNEKKLTDWPKGEW